MQNRLNTWVYNDEKKRNKNSNIATWNGVLIVQALQKMYANINSNTAVLWDVIRCTITIVSMDRITYIGTLLPYKPYETPLSSCDVTSQTTQFKVTAMRPTNINFRCFVLGKWHNLTSRRRAQTNSHFVFWRSRVQVSAQRPVTLTQVPHHNPQSQQ
jgi:hypothetical protein